MDTVLSLAAALPAEDRFPDDVDLRQAVIPKGRATLEEYLEAFAYTIPLLQTATSLERAAYELCEDAAAENVIHIEARFAPLLHTHRDLKPRDVVAAVLAGMHRAEAEFGISTGLILTALKQDSTEQSIETVQLAAQFRRDGVVGVDLAGPERLFSPRKHRKAIEFAHDAELNVTIHAGRVMLSGTDRKRPSIWVRTALATASIYSRLRVRRSGSPKSRSRSKCVRPAIFRSPDS